MNEAAPAAETATSVHALVERQAQRTPHAIAVELGAERITYAALDAAANRLAHLLLRQGVGPDSVVGVCLHRSVATLVTIFGVLKAGGAYLPLDLTHPSERLRFMLDDAEARVVVTERALLPLFLGAERDTICVDDLASEERRRNFIESPALVDRLAYVLYTSGSTGKPKGVAMPHRALINLLAWQAGRHPGPARTLHFAAATFDVSFQEVFSTWSTGGTVVIVPEPVRHDPARLLRLLIDARIERAFFPPVILRYLAEAAEQEGRLESVLREVIVAGEALHVTDRVVALFTRLGGPSLHNHYGPTETHVATAFQVPAPLAPGLPSVGLPITHVRACILGPDLLPVPFGEAGELCLGGPCLARGYFGNSRLTADRFIPDPGATLGTLGARLYRTGDRARYSVDGTIELLGRFDNQVKVRGFRVELGEIEAALRAHPNVRDATVVATEGEPSGIRLVAYAVARDPTSPQSPDSLRAHLRETLPEHMLPTAFVELEAMPLLPSGKTDRQALQRAHRGAEHAPSSPSSARARTLVEELLASVWAEVLQLDAVDLSDTFVALGGHSLHAARVTSRVRARLDVDLPVAWLFDGSSLATLATRIEALSGRSVGPDRRLVTSRTGGEFAPLTAAQESFWVLDQLDPRSATYTVTLCVRIDGPVDARLLEQSLGAITRRHAGLRTTFPSVQGEPCQRIGEPSGFSLGLVSLEDLPLEARDTQARRLAEIEAGRPFDLGQGPLFRATLFRLAKEAHTLLLTMPHILADGVSLGILSAELAGFYQALSTGQAAAVGDLGVQMSDVALCERERSTDKSLDEALDYWKTRLSGAPTTIDLPTDRPRPRARSHRGETHRFHLPGPLTAELQSLARREGVTLFMVLLAAFQSLLCRLSGQEDFVVGSPFAGRVGVETEGLIGCFVSTLPLRCDLSGDPTFQELLIRARETTLGAHAHQDVPSARLVQSLAPAARHTTSPLFQVMLVFEATTRPPSSLGAASLTFVEVERHRAMLDLSLLIQESPAGLSVAFEYATDLFDAATIEQMEACFRALLEGATADPTERVSRLSLLSAREREATLRLGVASAEVSSQPPLVHELFNAQAEATPEATAVIGGDRSLSYRALRRRANRLAHRLRSLGVGPDALVGVCVERSILTVVALLGILKAGGAYVPLDPSYPPDRLAFMAADAAFSVLVSDAASKGRFAPSGCTLVLLDDEGNEDEGEGEEAQDETPERQIGPNHAAYVLYTSGSTGRPKGVVIEHRGPASLIAWAKTEFSPADTRGVLLSTSISFDLSVFEVFLPLSSGGAVIVAKNALELPSLPAAGSVTLVNTVPSAMNELMRTGRLPPSTRVVCLAGEPLPASLVEQIHAATPGVRVYNLYGPTEDTTYSTATEVRRGEPVTIGRPVAGGSAYVLDPQGEPAPVGVAGELYLGGPGVAREYLRRPELTKARFVEAPFAKGGGARLYRTGDRCRFRADGTLEYLGRSDHQVKVRGHRIELGEIESALREHGAVESAVAAVRASPSGDAVIVAYLVGKASRRLPPADALRAHARRTLPDYMLPQAFVTLGALPKLPNGKIDRASLPAFGPLEAGGGPLPQTTTERALATLWAEVLGREGVGLRDDFFALGGHSLLAARLFDRVALRFGKTLPLATLFEAPTVERLAEIIDDRPGGRLVTPGRSPSIFALRREGSRPPLFLARPATRSSGALVYASLPRHIGPDRPVYAFLNRPLVDNTTPYASVEEMAREYISAMREVAPVGPYLLGGWSAAGLCAFEMANRLEAEGRAASKLLLLDAYAPLRARERAEISASRVVARARLRACARLPWLPSVVPSIDLIRSRSPMRRFGLLAYVDPTGDDIHLIEHAFPGRFDHQRLERMTPDERWCYIYAELKAEEPDVVLSEGSDGSQVRNGYRYFARDREIAARYSPTWVYRGDVAMVVVRPGADCVRGWRRFLTSRPEVHEVVTLGTATEADPHDAMMAEENVARMADTLHRVLASG